MFSKVLTILISTMALFSKERADGLNENLMLDIKQSIVAEIYAVSFKLIMGVILASGIIYSIFRLGVASEIVLSRLENGLYLEILVFGVAAIAGLIFLFLLFRVTPVRAAKGIVIAPQTFNLEHVATKFVEGFLQGLENPPPKKSHMKDFNPSVDF
jgi:hypothetical protein